MPQMYLQRDPDYVVYLDVSHEEITRRRRVGWGSVRLERQLDRLRRAREDADLIIHTDGLGANEIYRRVLQFIWKGAD